MNDTTNTTATTTAAVVFPADLMAEGMRLAKSTMKAQQRFALLWADAIAVDIDGAELIKASFVAAGFTARDSRGVVTNSSKFVAAALMVRSGAMTEKEFFSLKTEECAAAFKAAGGMKGDGLDPTAWQAARESNAASAAKPAASLEGRPPEGEAAAKTLSAFEVLAAAISLRKREMTPEEIDKLVALLRAE